jgi:hypothetical protein
MSFALGLSPPVRTHAARRLFPQDTPHGSSRLGRDASPSPRLRSRGSSPPQRFALWLLRLRACFSPVPDSRFTTLPDEPCPATPSRRRTCCWPCWPFPAVHSCPRHRSQCAPHELYPSKTFPRRQPVPPHDGPCPPAVTRRSRIAAAPTFPSPVAVTPHAPGNARARGFPRSSRA